MRKYQPIWEQLKLHSTVSLSATPALHKRIIKAVIKEKLKDLGYKLICAESGTIKKLAYTTNGKLITFNLEIDRSIRNL